MPQIPTGRPRLFRPLAILALALASTATAPAARAQSPGWPQSYSVRWYGQNFYDGQRDGIFGRRFWDRQYHAGNYGPPMLYSRQYGDYVGNIRDKPFSSTQTGGRYIYGSPFDLRD